MSKIVTTGAPEVTHSTGSAHSAKSDVEGLPYVVENPLQVPMDSREGSNPLQVPMDFRE